MPRMRDSLPSRRSPPDETERMAVSQLADFQRDFTAALFGEIADDSPMARIARQAGFDVYRNSVMVACVDALAASYPSVAQLVGDDWFRDAAAIFVRQRLPLAGAMARYGEGFADFLAGFEPARELPYLSGVAQLDRLWTEAHLAADAPVLDAGALGDLSPGQLAAAVLVPHPAARWATFAELPVYTIWRRHREGLSPGDDLSWQGESALLVRPAGRVSWQALERDAATFMSGCAEGRPFVDIVDALPEPPADGSAGPGQWLPMLVAAGAFTRIEGAGR